MANYSRGILGPVKGSIAHINAYSTYGKNRIRIKATTRKNSTSQLQSNARAAFKEVNDFLLPIYTNLVKLFYSFIPAFETDWFQFMKLNRQYFNESGLFNPEPLLLSSGSVAPVVDFAFLSIGGDNVARFRYTNNFMDEGADINDTFYGVIYNHDLKSSQLFTSHPTRITAQVSQLIPAGWLLTHSFSIYTMFLRFDGTDGSDTAYLAL